eukprot:GILI01000911.1.p1 GENE.GILI01000911.1~~GILI01000911.1.p1  ORF type:complete len:673 (-),score=210.59 GILI01000911.1:996-3014(-)
MWQQQQPQPQQHQGYQGYYQPQQGHAQQVYQPQAPQQSNPYPKPYGQQAQQPTQAPAQPQQQQQVPQQQGHNSQPYQQVNPYRPGSFHHTGGSTGGYGGGNNYGRGGYGSSSRGGYNNFNSYGSHNNNDRGSNGPAPVALTPYTREEKDVEEIFKDQSAGIDFSKYEEIQISLTPNTVPPCDTFEGMNVAPALDENIRRCKYTKPTPVQRQGIPPVLQGGDLMACAQTGSGKTAAYLIPAIHDMLTNRSNGGSGRCATPSALILAPTRELGIQIYEESRKFTYHTTLRCVVVYGGADPRYQLNELSRGCNLLVATPGRLLDFFNRACVKFSEIRFIVLDEADRMLDMGFEPQIRQIVQGPESDMPTKELRQTLMYSATFPRDIQQLAREFLKREHFFLQVGRVGSTTESITQDVREVDDADKRTELINVLTEHQNEFMLVFVEKKRDADFLERFLYQRGFAAASIHGDRAQREREMALASFKQGRVNVLVATDVAARGLDIPDVTLVVQYDLPSNIDSYVHRIGRTGRAGKKGLAVSFFNEKNKNIVDEMVELMDESKQATPDWLRALVTKRPQQNFGRGRGNFGRGGGRGFGFAGGRGGNFGGPRGGFSNAPRGGFAQNNFRTARDGFAGQNGNHGNPHSAGHQPRHHDPNGGQHAGHNNNGGFNFRQNDY